MKSHIHIISLCLLYVAAGCTPSAKEDGLGHDHSHHHHTEHSHDHDGHNSHAHGHEAHDHEHDAAASEGAHSDEIILTPHQAEQFGVRTAKVEPTSFNNAIKVSGQVLPATGSEGIVTAPSAGIVKFNSTANLGASVRKGQALASISGKGLSGGDANEAAAIEYEAAKRELERVTPLHADGIVSTAAYNAALRAYDTAKAAYTGQRGGSSASAPVAGVITALLVAEGQYVDAGTPIASVSGNRSLTLRADLPEREAASLASIGSAKFTTTASSQVYDTKELNGKIITAPASATGNNQRPGYIPVYFTFDNTGAIIAGAYADVYLLTSPRDNVISLPKEALVEQQGNHFAYVKLDEEGYEKRKVTLGASDGSAYEILSGLHPGEEVVVAGAIAVKLAESSGAVPEGHSHNH